MNHALASSLAGRALSRAVAGACLLYSSAPTYLMVNLNVER